MKIEKQVGTAIRSLRIQNNLSQEKLASIVGMHRTYIGMIERGEKNVTVNSLNKIASGLNTKAWEILKVIDI